MKLACKIKGKAALVVGYVQSKRQKVLAVVICEGELRSVRLRDIELLNVPEGLAKPSEKIVAMSPRREA